MTQPEEESVPLADAQALLRNAAKFVELTAAREETHARVVRLARRITHDGLLTDEEAVRRAGELALRVVLAARRANRGR